MRGRVLIVDDEKLMRVSLEAQLQKEGFFVKSMKTAGDAFKYVRNEDFDIVVSDLRLPGLDGIEKYFTGDYCHNNDRLWDY